VRLGFDDAPRTVTYCHCADCRRWTGGPVAAFAALPEDGLRATPPLGDGRSCVTGVRRWNCGTCGSPLAATFDYLPGQIYVPLGIIDQIEALPPARHSQIDGKPAWLHLGEDLPGSTGSDRAFLNQEPNG
jgi:hypothetical protein